MEEVLSVSGISKSFGKGSEAFKALDSVSLSIRKGEIYGLLGPNGAGKTTLISILCGLLRPDSGSATVLGLDAEREYKSIQRRINVVSGFSGVLYSLTLFEALKYYALLYDVKGAQGKIESLIKMTGLEHARNRTAEDMSSGMKQRFLIAKGLLNDPEILILDEPTVGLDVESAITIRKMVKDVRKSGRTILLTTHNMFEAEELCDRISFINKGRIVTSGTPKELKDKIIKDRIIEVHCSDEACVVSRLSKVPGVSAGVSSPRIVRLRLDSYSRMNGVLKALSSCDGEVYGLKELEPTFEETYLKLINSGGKA